jgi:hypothetical protein
MLQLTSGLNSAVDVGYGPGLFPIVSVSSSGVTLSETLTSTESDSYQFLVILRNPEPALVDSGGGQHFF